MVVVLWVGVAGCCCISRCEFSQELAVRDNLGSDVYMTDIGVAFSIDEFISISESLFWTMLSTILSYRA